jgi:hypothetical protein
MTCSGSTRPLAVTSRTRPGNTPPMAASSPAIARRRKARRAMPDGAGNAATARGLAACRPCPRPYRGRLPRLAGPGTRMHGSRIHGPRLRHALPSGDRRRTLAYAALAAHARAAFRRDRPDLGVARSDVVGLLTCTRQQAQWGRRCSRSGRRDRRREPPHRPSRRPGVPARRPRGAVLRRGTRSRSPRRFQR